MPLLYYWRGDNHRRDLDKGAAYHLNHRNQLLHSVQNGDSLWAFTRAEDGAYSLAAQLVVSGRTHNPAGHPYGPYRLWGHLKHSRYFQVGAHNNVEPIIRMLSTRAKAQHLGQSFQGMASVRTLTTQDHQLLTKFAHALPPEPRAALLPELPLENHLYLDDKEQLEAWLNTRHCGIAPTRRQWLVDTIARNRTLAPQLQNLYCGRCQICEWSPKDLHGVYACEGHHIQWLSRSGSDALENMALLCPNHHRIIHKLDGHFDFQERAFVLSNDQRLKVQLDHHLPSGGAHG